MGCQMSTCIQPRGMVPPVLEMELVMELVMVMELELETELVLHS